MLGRSRLLVIHWSNCISAFAFISGIPGVTLPLGILLLSSSKASRSNNGQIYKLSTCTCTSTLESPPHVVVCMHHLPAMLSVYFTMPMCPCRKGIISPIPIIDLIIGTNARNIPAHVVQELGTYLVTEHRLDDQRSQVELPQGTASASRKGKWLTYNHSLL